MKRAGALLLAFVCSFAASEARTQSPPPVVLDVEGLFTDTLFGVESGASAVVDIHNRGSRPLSLELVLEAQRFSEPMRRYRRRLDLGAGTRRAVPIELPGAPPGAMLSVIVREGERELARATESIVEQSGPGIVLLLSRTPRLVAGLHDLAITEPTSSFGYGGASTIERAIAVASPRISPHSGEPMLPDSVFGYGMVALIVATPDELERLDEEALAVLEGFVETGGALLLGLARPTDVERAVVRRFAGALEAASPPEPPRDDALRIDAAPRIGFVGEGAIPLSFGAMLVRGHGRVVLTPFDPNEAAFATDPQVRRLFVSLLELRNHAAPLLKSRRPGRGAERSDLMETETTAAPSRGDMPFGYARRALDVGLHRRPPMALVALLVVLYAVLVGPVATVLARRRRNALLPIVMVPVVAAGFLALLLGIGVTARGITDRARVVQWLDGASGSPTFAERSYVGLHFGPSRALAVEGRSGERLVVVTERDRTSVGTLEVGGATSSIEGLPARFWDTIHLRRERVLRLGGGVEITAEARRVVSIANRTGRVLRDVVVLDEDGLRAVGEIAIDETRRLTPDLRAEHIDRTSFRVWSALGTNQSRLLERLGIANEQLPLALALFAATRGIGVTEAGIGLIARVEVDREAVPPGFSIDSSLALLTVALVPDPPHPALPIVRIDPDSGDAEASDLPDAGVTNADADVLDGGAGAAVSVPVDAEVRP